MKVVILAGGKGTRLSEVTSLKPKPMVEVGGQPILWHIMKIYAAHGLNDFVICCGHKGFAIREYFSNYFLHTSDVTFDLRTNSVEYHQNRAEPWRVTLMDTGEETMTGGRLKRVQHLLKDQDAFCFTYGDGVGDVDITALLDFHKGHQKLATMTATLPPGRFGALNIVDNQITRFKEKPRGDGARVNGGFFVLSPKVIDYIEDDTTTWEQEPLMSLANDGELMSFSHDGFWQPMDNVRDMQVLNDLWARDEAPWKVWK
ncbi:MAG: glucose-1-phosphate cytidylyltransferase [Pseudomonadota bacterium]